MLCKRKRCLLFVLSSLFLRVCQVVVQEVFTSPGFCNVSVYDGLVNCCVERKEVKVLCGDAFPCVCVCRVQVFKWLRV